MVNGKVNLAAIALRVFWQQTQRCNIRGHDLGRYKVLGRFKGLKIRRGGPGLAGIVQQICLLSQRTQTQTQRCGAAHCVPIGTHMR